jgi:hypothetical protein
MKFTSKEKLSSQQFTIIEKNSSHESYDGPAPRMIALRASNAQLEIPNTITNHYHNTHTLGVFVDRTSHAPFDPLGN